MKSNIIHFLIQLFMLILEKMLLPYIAGKVDANTKANITVTCDQINQIISEVLTKE